MRAVSEHDKRAVTPLRLFEIFMGKAQRPRWGTVFSTKVRMVYCAIVKLTAKKGFANPAHINIDSTVQTPDMQYPATVNLLVKAAAVGRRVQKILTKFMPETIKHVPDIDMKVIKGIAKQHYFEKSKFIKQKVEARK